MNAVGNVYVNVAIFLAFVVVTLVVVYRAARGNRTASDYYAAGRAFTGAQNGVAIAATTSPPRRSSASRARSR